MGVAIIHIVRHLTSRTAAAVPTVTAAATAAISLMGGIRAHSASTEHLTGQQPPTDVGGMSQPPLEGGGRRVNIGAGVFDGGRG